MEFIEEINGIINDLVWGAPAIILIMGVGLYMTLALKFIQFRNWGFLIHNTYVKAFKKAQKDHESEGEISSFQAAMASVSAVVGSGNLAGVATAIVSGGPGALFWMEVAAVVGMATKFAEIFLGVKYREKAEDGSYVGGPMYYVAKGLNAPWLGKLVSVLFLFFSVVISAVVDTNTISGAFEESLGINPTVTGVILAGLCAIVIFGGITRIGEVCGLMAPFMAGVYIISGLMVIFMNLSKVPEAISLIITAAFNPESVMGGAAGITVMTVMRYGMARGIFSNEAGLGSAGVTHAAAKVNDPAEQAIWGPLEVFVDTIIVCTITGLTVVLGGLWKGDLDGVALTMASFEKLLPGTFGKYMVLCVAALFGFSCLITFYNYMEKAWIHLFGPKTKMVAKAIWIVFILIGSQSTLGLVWDLADTCNGLIIIPNLIALLFLSKEVIAGKESFFARELPKYDASKK